MPNKAIKITAISYLNTIPFIYGIQKSGLLDNYTLQLEVPSVSAKKILNHKADIGLVPVALLENLKDYQIITDYCIGAQGKVKSVVLLSHKPLAQIKTVFLDVDSLTSVNLVKVLAKHYWKINPEWKNQTEPKVKAYENYESIVAIGDKTFDLINKFEFCYDLSEEWFNFTGLPFVFACWVSVSAIAEQFITNFSKAIDYGVKNIGQSINEIPKGKYENINITEYLTQQISFKFDDKKREALNLFLKLIANH